MKLYATVTTERASKGQGGNEHLETTYTVEQDGQRVPVGRTVLRKDANTYVVRHIPVHGDATEYRVPINRQ